MTESTGKGGVGKKGDGDKIAEALVAQRVGTGLATASSVAASNREVTNTARDDAPEIKDTLLKPGKAEGAQLEPAVMTPQGALPHQHVATGSGPMPAGIVARDEDEAEAMGRLTAAESKRRLARGAHREITAEELLAMRPAEVRAIAHDRGYDVGEGGIRRVISRFLAEQKKDELIDVAAEGSKAVAAARKEVDAADELRAETSHVGPATAGGIVTGVPNVADPAILTDSSGAERKSGLGTDKPLGSK